MPGYPIPGYDYPAAPSTTPARGAPCHPGAALALLLRRRSRRVLPPPGPVYDDLLSAVERYLRAAPTLLAVSGLKIYTGTGPVGILPPYVLLLRYSERLPGLSPADEPTKLTITVRGSTMTETRAISALVRNALDSPAYNRSAVGRAPFTFDGGREVLVRCAGSNPQRLTGLGAGSVYVLDEQIIYEFVCDWSGDS